MHGRHRESGVVLKNVGRLQKPADCVEQSEINSYYCPFPIGCVRLHPALKLGSCHEGECARALEEGLESEENLAGVQVHVACGSVL